MPVGIGLNGVHDFNLFIDICKAADIQELNDYLFLVDTSISPLLTEVMKVNFEFLTLKPNLNRFRLIVQSQDD